jgi:hypothetical protein
MPTYSYNNLELTPPHDDKSFIHHIVGTICYYHSKLTNSVVNCADYYSVQ